MSDPMQLDPLSRAYGNFVIQAVDRLADAMYSVFKANNRSVAQFRIDVVFNKEGRKTTFSLCDAPYYIDYAAVSGYFPTDVLEELERRSAWNERHQPTAIKLLETDNPPF